MAGVSPMVLFACHCLATDDSTSAATIEFKVLGLALGELIDDLLGLLRCVALSAHFGPFCEA